MASYEAVIGLEIHAELLTASKVFCGCKAAFGGEPNTQCCPICLGLPGALPKLNENAAAHAIKAALALHCEIAAFSTFDRKIYFYPDLPKGYQITQYARPFGENGYVDFMVGGERCRVGIARVHLEEEVGKSVHSGDNILGSDYSLIDYNRAGIPLIEIVTKPDLTSAAQTKAFLEELKCILQYANVSDCKMEEGSLRCDANVSVRPVGSQELRTKVEVKNLNSFRAVERSVDYEMARQKDRYAAGDRVVQETRAWDDEVSCTVPMRTKGANRHIPDPDVPPMIVNSRWVEDLQESLPELPLAKRVRFMESYGLPPSDSEQITQSKAVATYFEETVAHDCEPRSVANWLKGEFARLLNHSNLTIDRCNVDPRELASLIKLTQQGTISGKQAKEVFADMFATGKTAADIVKAKGLEQISDTQELAGLIDQTIAANPDEVNRFQAGEEKLLGFFVGQVMRETRGKGNPQIINHLLRERLSKS